MKFSTSRARVDGLPSWLWCAAGWLLLAGGGHVRAEILPPITFERQDDQVVIRFGQRPVATYVFRDPRISRPYLAHVKAPDGQQVTRNHPPIAGQDATDHASFHPGIWMAFGDISGNDYWRLKARVVHDGLVADPVSKPGWGEIRIRNRYLDAGGKKTVCREVCRLTWQADPHAYLLTWESTFSGDHEFYFGDQEEMGLAFRMATPLTVTKGGRILDSAGRKNGQQVWGQQADWCDYSGILGDRRLGIVIMPGPGNFRRSWNHARDYGVLAANPFGVRAFTRGQASRVVVRPGESLRLRYGLWIYSVPATEKIRYALQYRNFINAPTVR